MWVTSMNNGRAPPRDSSRGSAVLTANMRSRYVTPLSLKSPTKIPNLRRRRRLLHECSTAAPPGGATLAFASGIGCLAGGMYWMRGLCRGFRGRWCHATLAGKLETIV